MRSFHREALVMVLLAAPGAFAQVTPEGHVTSPAGKETSTSEPGKKADGGAKSAKELQADQGKMQALMEEIQKTDDVAKRKRLLEQHQKMMHEELQAMQHMKCPMMGADGNAQTGKAPPGKMGGDRAQCHQMMEERMDMTTVILEQMLEHEEAER